MPRDFLVSKLAQTSQFTRAAYLKGDKIIKVRVDRVFRALPFLSEYYMLRSKQLTMLTYFIFLDVEESS